MIFFSSLHNYFSRLVLVKPFGSYVEYNLFIHHFGGKDVKLNVADVINNIVKK